MFRNLAVVYGISAIVLFVGFLLPWATVLNISAHGNDTDDGKVMLILACLILLAAVLDWLDRFMLSLILGGMASAAALALAIYEIIHIGNDHDPGLHGLHVSAGAGLWVCLVGAAIGIIGSFALLRIHRHSVRF